MDEITIKSQKVKLGKKFILLCSILVVALAVLTVVAFSKFQTYKEYQEVAVSLALGFSDEFEEYEDDYEKMVEEMYNFFEPPYISYTYNGVKINNQDVVDAAREADKALGNLMTELGYSCYAGSIYLEYTEFFDYFFNCWYDDVDTIKIAFEICGAFLVIVLLLNLVYASYNKELVIDGDTILCKKGKKTAKQFMIKDVKSVQTKSLKGIKISGNGLRYSVILVKNRDEIQKAIMDKVAALAERAEQNLNVVMNNTSAEDIKKFKELLDSGVITQEEFDAKKKQLLGL